MSRHDSILEEKDVRRLWLEVLPGLLHDVYTMRSSRQSVITATAAAALMRQRYRPVSQELNMASCDCPCDCCTDYTNWNQSHRLAIWHDTWNAEETLSRNCKTTTLFFGKRTAKNTEGKDPRMPGAAMHRLHICCTMRANGSFVIRGNAEFFGCGKAIMGNLRNVPHLIFHKLPLSAIRIPQNTRALVQDSVNTANVR